MALRAASLLVLVLAAIAGQAYACPFASMLQGDLDAPGRKLLQATCNIAAVDQVRQLAGSN